jgi:hypothetical protein
MFVFNISTAALAATTPPHFIAHGWEPWTATQILADLARDPAAWGSFQRAVAGSALRFGGISADFLHYVDGAVDGAVADTAGSTRSITACEWHPEGTFNPDLYECPFSTSTFDLLRDELGMPMIFDLNELTGRNCTHPGPKPWQPAEYCGRQPAPWRTDAVEMLLKHIAKTTTGHGLVGLELGNELWKPPHLVRDTAIADILQLTRLVDKTFPEGERPKVYGFGTNTCNSETEASVFAGLDAAGAHFSYHNYPGDSVAGDKDLRNFVMNVTWLRTKATGQDNACLQQWKSGGYKGKGMSLIVTEAAATSGSAPEGAPGVADFIHGFFSIAELGQFALMGVDMVARWSLTGGSGLITPPHPPHRSDWDAASDLFLYALYNRTVGHGVLSVSGAESPTDRTPLMYAHCSTYSNGSVTLLVANPSATAVVVALGGAHALPLLPRVEYVLTPHQGDISAHAPVLNGEQSTPLQVGKEDGTLPDMAGKWCGLEGCGRDGSWGSGGRMTLPAHSQSLIVLPYARVGLCER